MDLSQKYHLIELLPGEGVQSYRARQTNTGREVTVHLLVGGKTPENEATLVRLRAMQPQSMAKLIEVGEQQGNTFVVTVAPPFQRLDAWLAEQDRVAAVAKEFGKATVWKRPAVGSLVPRAALANKMPDASRRSLCRTPCPLPPHDPVPPATRPAAETAVPPSLRTWCPVVRRLRSTWPSIAAAWRADAPGLLHFPGSSLPPAGVPSLRGRCWSAAHDNSARLPPAAIRSNDIFARDPYAVAPFFHDATFAARSPVPRLW